MARYLGPKCKLARREGTDLFLKSGVKPLESQVQARMPSPASTARASGTRTVRLRHAAAREAEGASRMYGVLERQFRSYFDEGVDAARATPARTCCSCSSRASTTSCTAWASARRAPRRASWCRTTAITVNGKPVNIAVVPGQGRRRRSRCARRRRSSCASGRAAARRAGRLPDLGRGRREEVRGHVQGGAGPRRDSLPDINESLVVELYSK